jgi:hypothetical protein
VPKRYVLLLAKDEITDRGLEELQDMLVSRYGNVKLISVKGNARAVIVKTTNEIAPLLRGPGNPLAFDGNRVEPILTSGAVGNLKRRALQAKADGQVSER